MARWQELPEDLDPAVRQLVVQLRRLKDRSGLSLAALGERTGRGKSSWERYLNGRKLAPAAAVESLAGICGADPVRLLAVQEVAERAWTARGGMPDAACPEPGPEPDGGTTSDSAEAADDAPGAVHGEAPRRSLLAGGAIGLVVGVVVTALVAWALRPVAGGEAAGRAAASASSRPAAASGYRCRVERHAADHRLYAGDGVSNNLLVVAGQSGGDVAEVQCLLRHEGFDPGAVDGVFGSTTERAVMQAQRRGGVVVDGKVGPDTWRVLRTWHG